MPVAVKMVKKSEDQALILEEVNALIRIEPHTNVLFLFGIFVDNDCRLVKRGEDSKSRAEFTRSSNFVSSAICEVFYSPKGRRKLL